MFAIWLLPNHKDTEYLQKIINKLSLKFNSPKFLPHITIYGLLSLDLNKIEKVIKNSIYEIKPFVVNKKEIEESDNIWKSLFINIEKNNKLFLINNKLSEGFIEINKKEFSPHISLLYAKLTKLQKLEIIKNLKIKNEIEINRIAILKFSKNINKWKIVKVFELTFKIIEN